MTSLEFAAGTLRLGVAGGQIDNLPMTHAAFGHDVVGKFLHVNTASFEDRHLHAALLVQMNVQRRLREVMVIVKVAGQPFRQLALLVIVNIDERGKARVRPGDLRRALLQAGSHQIAYGFRAIGIAVRRHVTLQLRRQIVVDCYGDTLHRWLSCVPV